MSMHYFQKKAAQKVALPPTSGHKGFVRLKYLAFPLTLILICSFQPVKEAATRSLSRSIGIVSLRDGKGCLAIRNTSDLTRARLRVVSLLGSSRARSARIGGRSEECTASASDPAIRYWQVELSAGAFPAGEFSAIGILNYSGQFHRDGTEVSADLDGDGRPEYLRSCTSAEGIHFTIWTGAPLKGRLRWHQYSYLGYDVTPSCTEAETKQPN
jgi:hypothetical protein